MEPYYETENGKLYCGDSFEILSALQSEMSGGGYIYILTDPPYGIKADKGVVAGGVAEGRKYEDSWDSTTPKTDHFKLMLDIADDLIIFGGNFFTDKLPQSNKWFVWDKVLDMPNNTTLSDCELIYTTLKGNAIKKLKYLQAGFIAYEKERYHPTQKPVGLIKLILDEYCNEKDSLIIDPFSGSGTTAIACEQAGRKWICIEKEKKYCDITIQRLKTIQQSLF